MALTITDILLIVMLNIMMFGLFQIMKADITITYKQEFSEQDRKLLEDLYNDDGELKKDFNAQEAFDAIVQSVNDIMLDRDEEA